MNKTGYGNRIDRVKSSNRQIERLTLPVVLAAVLLCSVVPRGHCDEVISYPPVPDETLFSALRETSPFLRTLDISETYVLRAVATFEDIGYARVFNRETEQTITIELGGEPQAGMELVKIISPPAGGSLSGVSARISFAGEIAELKYSPEQLDPVRRSGPSRGGPSRGKGPPRGKGPSSQDREKYMQLSEDRKQKLREYIKATVQKYPDMPREERGNLIRGAMQKLADGRDIEIPK